MLASAADLRAQLFVNQSTDVSVLLVSTPLYQRLYHAIEQWTLCQGTIYRPGSFI